MDHFTLYRLLAAISLRIPWDFHVQEMTFLPPPVQSPRIPIWVVGAWPRMKSKQRVLRWDGVIPSRMHEDGSFSEMTPTDLQAVRAYLAEQHVRETPFDIVMEGETPGDDLQKALSIVSPLAEAGVTWWLEGVCGIPGTRGGDEDRRTRIQQGPPRP
jgi:hypothetical protein